MTRTGLLRALPALLLLAAASAASLAPEAFVLTRAGLARGEVWRLWTGHLVHMTTMHFVYDVGVGMALLWVAPRVRPWLWLMPLVAVAVLQMRPELDVYAGLSGVLHGITVLVGFQLARTAQGFDRLLAGLLVAGVCVKAAVECLVGTSYFSGAFDMGGVTLHEAHLAGVLVGLALLVVHGRPRATLRA